MLKAPLILDHAPEGSICGRCAVCCVYPPIDELNKPEDQPCPHLGSSGCLNYENRPAFCKEFRCDWLKYMLADDAPKGMYKNTHRPDRSGLFIEGFADGRVIVDSLEPNAIDTPYGKDLVSRLSTYPVPVIIRDARGPGRHVALFEGKRKEFSGDKVVWER